MKTLVGFPHVLATLRELEDDQLRTIVAEAQGCLLDRPDSPTALSRLAVEVVGSEESRLLTMYRLLAPAAQRRVLRYVQYLYSDHGGAAAAG